MIQSKTNNHLYGLYSFAFSLKSYGISSTKEQVRKNKLFLQNEPNFRKSQINLSNYMTRDYVQMDTWSIRKNEPKTNPNEPKTNPILANKTPIRTQFKPKQTQFLTAISAAGKRPNTKIFEIGRSLRHKGMRVWIIYWRQRQCLVQLRKILLFMLAKRW